RRRAALAAAAAYREAMREFAAMRALDVWYARLDAEAELARLEPTLKRHQSRRAEKVIAKAEHKDSLRALGKLTRREDGEVHIVSDPPLITPIAELAAGHDVERELDDLLAAYGQSLDADRRRLLADYHLVDAARKVVGVGSVGTRDWVVLLFGRDDEDPLFLQPKEAVASVLEPYAGKSRFNHHGRRVVEGQRLMQAAGDILLGWVSAEAGLDGQR